MAIRLCDLLKDERELAIEAEGGEVLNVVYRPSAITAETQDLYFELLERSRVGAGQAELLAQRLVSWDLTDDEGVELGVDVGTLRKIPVDVLSFVNGAIVADMMAGDDDRKNSGGGSRRRGRSGSRRGTTS